jgi:hypothetical protein
MAGSSNPRPKQVPTAIIEAIVKLKGRLKVWDT